MWEKRRVTAAGIVLGAALLVRAGQAEGGPITFYYEGTVTDFSDPDGLLDGSVGVGVTFAGSYTFESTMTDDFPGDPTYGQYTTPAPPSSIMSTTLGNYTFVGSSDEITVQNGFNDVFGMGSREFESEGFEIGHMIVWMKDDDGTAFLTDALPLTPPDLDDFPQQEFSLIEGIAGNLGFIVSGPLTSLTPEPTSICMFALGTLALIRHRRRN